MPRRLSIATFVDACGWEVLETRPWFLADMPHRQRLESIFGYSSACVPAILTGRLPEDNDHWSSFYYSPATSPFRRLRFLRLLPRVIADRSRVRAWISRLVARAYGFTGYFQLYDIPFEALPLFDYAEKRDLFRPGGANRGETVFDELERRGTIHHVSDWRRSDAWNVDALRHEIDQGHISFAFLYTARLDALMHRTGREHPAVDEALRWYAAEIGSLLELARSRYDEVRFALFSDHGMCTVERTVDLIPRVEATGLGWGQDYAAIYDSTMMRFWFLRPGAEEAVVEALPDGPDGRWVTEREHAAYGTLFEDGRYGHAIYALEPGVLLCPSHMGRSPVRGMHGYRPEHPDSDAAVVASFEPRAPLGRITDLRRLVLEMAAWADRASVRPDPLSRRFAEPRIRRP